ncbi:hypothetical protein BKD26_31905 [Streptomyces sp. CB03238]|nr:hypothetical protein BKD26_31905 [Streptomyces sp. CB03238]
MGQMTCPGPPDCPGRPRPGPVPGAGCRADLAGHRCPDPARLRTRRPGLTSRGRGVRGARVPLASPGSPGRLTSPYRHTGTRARELCAV